MDRGKPVQEGVRIKLPAGTTWQALARTTRVEQLLGVARHEIKLRGGGAGIDDLASHQRIAGQYDEPGIHDGAASSGASVRIDRLGT